MAELTPRDRLQPFLLDRLTDLDPGNPRESREQRVVTAGHARKALLRDLGWLLNACAHPLSDHLERFPEVERSVLNYGTRELSGQTASRNTGRDVERIVTEAILAFEPRIIPQSLHVKAIEVAEQGGANIVFLEIRGDAWNLPMPDSFYVRTEVDLETGQCELRE